MLNLTEGGAAALEDAAVIPGDGRFVLDKGPRLIQLSQLLRGLFDAAERPTVEDDVARPEFIRKAASFLVQAAVALPVLAQREVEAVLEVGRVDDGGYSQRFPLGQGIRRAGHCVQLQVIAGAVFDEWPDFIQHGSGVHAPQLHACL